MSSSRTTSKGIRIKNEVAEYFNGKPLNRYIESMYEHILMGEIEETEEGICVHSKNEGVPKKGSVEDVHTKESDFFKRLKMDAAPFGMSAEELGEKLLDGMDSGRIIYENGEFRAEERYDLNKLEEECRCKGIPMEKVIASMIQMVERM